MEDNSNSDTVSADKDDDGGFAPRMVRNYEYAMKQAYEACARTAEAMDRPEVAATIRKLAFEVKSKYIPGGKGYEHRCPVFTKKPL